MSDRLHRLFAPKSVAVIGGGAWCSSVLQSLDRMGFAGTVWHVHPKADGAVRAVKDLPDAPDACFIGVNRAATIDVVKALSQLGAGGAVCFASGFAEAEDGADLSTQLLQAAGGMAIVGPNCYGFVNALDRVAVWPDVHGLVPVEAGVAILTQSSNIALNISMQQRGLPVGFLGTAGNQAQIGIAQMAQHLIHDPRITALGLHIEGVGDLSELQALAQQSEKLGKPIIVFKPGVSDAAQIAAVSHTASLAGSDSGAGALFQRLGLKRVRTLDAMIEALKHAHLYGAIAPGSIASLSCSGGEASLMADGGDLRGLHFADLTPEQDAALETTLGPLVTRANPLDYHTFIWNDADTMAKVYGTMAQGTADLTIVVVDFPRADRCQTTHWDCVIEAARQARSKTGARIALLATFSENMPEALAAELMADGILPLSGMEAALDALAALYNDDVTADPHRDIPIPCPSADPAMLDEAAAKAALVVAGLDVPKGVSADTPDEIAAKAALILPVALKARGLAHKSDAGGVVLDLSCEDAIRAAALTMDAESYYAEEMITDGVVELLVAILADPAHGYVLTLGAGGVLTELWADTQHLLVPATASEIDAALTALRIGPMLDGYRSKPAIDRNAVISAILRLQDYVVAQSGRVAEIEINPLILTPTRAVVADALIRKDM